MKTFKLTQDVSGYSRGYYYVEVQAETLEEARELADDSDDVEYEVIRSDMESDGNWEEVK